MCLAVPGKVIAIDGVRGRVVFSGVERWVQLDLVPEVQVGEFVLVHAGFAIQRMDAQEAEETLSLLEQVAPELDVRGLRSSGES